MLFFGIFFQFLFGFISMQEDSEWPPNAQVNDGETFDYIIVGAGSAGSVLASRLTELKHLRVLTIEAGGNPNDKGFVSVLDSEYVFSYQSQYSASTGQAQKIPGVVPLLRGKMLGGSSSCNGMWYCRGNPEDYNFWVESGFNGWDWNTVFPYFLRSENFTGDLVMRDPVYSSYHNTTGPLKVTQPIEGDSNYKRAMDIMQTALDEIGIRPILDYNGPSQFGASPLSLTFSDERVRSSTARAFLRPNKDRENMFILKYAYATKILIDENQTAYGVEVYVQNKTVSFYANKEILVCAGALNTPKLLMASGIGPRENMNNLNISVISELPVGSNLQDHFLLPILLTGVKDHEYTDKANSVYPTLNGFYSVENFRRPEFQVSTNFYSKSSEQIGGHFSFVLNYNDNLVKDIEDNNINQEIIVVQIQLLHPKSSGKVIVKGVDYDIDPEFYMDYFSDKEDLELTLKGIKEVLKVRETTYFRNANSSVVELDLPACKDYTFLSDEYWKCYALAMSASGFHPARTCAMGKVVDTNFKVYGVNSLRVIDASVFYDMPSGNLNAVVIMMAERAADLIKNGL
ncbi:ecdysone oxidase [Plutella xylostella]|uniref:ecdysone oxidase n=1 Tax=Plutella xylostella TaxID=51655 RepID=UPI002032BDEC|nr:ecdysone oxidase [Plutella xylostella]